MEKLIQIEQVLQIGAKLLQIGAAPVVTNWGNSYYKLGQFQLLQIVPKLLQIGQNYYRLGQVLQIGTIITNRCRTGAFSIILFIYFINLVSLSQLGVL